MQLFGLLCWRPKGAPERLPGWANLSPGFRLASVPAFGIFRGVWQGFNNRGSNGKGGLINGDLCPKRRETPEPHLIVAGRR